MEKSKFRSLTPRPDKFFDSTLADPLGMMDEEDESVNKQLVLIHKEYDKIKTSNRKKQSLINKLRQDVNAAKRSSSSMFEDRYVLDTRVSQLENYLETVINKRKEEENLMKSYQYLLDRIKEDKNSLDKEFQSKQADLISKKNILTVEEKRAKKQHEKALKDKIQLKLLNEDLEKEKRLQEDTLMLIQKKANERSKAILLLEESSRNRELIADAAQGQVSNAETIQFRNKLLLYQFCNCFQNTS